MTTVPLESHSDTTDASSVDDMLSTDSKDNLIPRPPATERHNLWPAVFPIPSFSYNTEMALRQGNERFLKDGTPLTTPSVKSDILERLAEAMFSYTAYPNDPQRAAVAQALIEKHPCLREPGSFNGFYGWQQSLKYKCGNYRSKLKAHGNPELMINTLKHKQDGDKKPAKNIKKPRKSEVNYLPPHPAGQTDDSLENVRLALIAASMTEDNRLRINDMMSRTYSCRRREVVGQSMHVAEFKERWPALFDPFQVNKLTVTMFVIWSQVDSSMGRASLMQYSFKTHSYVLCLHLVSTLLCDNTYIWVTVILNPSAHSLMTSDINKAFSSTQRPLTGYFLFFGLFSVNPRDGCAWKSQ